MHRAQTARAERSRQEAEFAAGGNDPIQVVLNQLAECTPEQAASRILEHCKGDVRESEALTWTLYDRLMGGSWGSRPDPKKDQGVAAGRSWSLAVLYAIEHGTEDPRVERAPVKRIALPY